MRTPGIAHMRRRRSHLAFDELNFREEGLRSAATKSPREQTEHLKCSLDPDLVKQHKDKDLCGPCHALTADLVAYYGDTSGAPSTGRPNEVWIKTSESKLILKDHHNDYKSLLASSWNCRICHLIASAWFNTSGRRTHATLKYRIQRGIGDHAFSLWTQTMESCGNGCCANLHDDFQRFLDFEPFRKRGDVESSELEVEVLSTTTDIRSFIGREVPLRSDGGLCHEAISRWLKSCKSSHPRCRRNESAVLPKRVRFLDVRPPSGGEDVRIHERLYREVAPYLALSHCWGGRSPFCTTTNNYESSKEGLRLRDFPRTFHDAVLLTRSLGYQYLWIDALCIIQDDPSDWDRQAEFVGDIYRNADFTISAMRAPDCKAGLFHPRKSLHAPLRTHRSSEMDAQQLYIRPAYDSSFDSSLNISGPLSERAWVLQERLLSPAVLHFTSNEIIWECRTQTLFEHGAHAEPKDHEVKLLLTTGQRNKSNRSASPWRMSREERFKRWYKLVQIYSGKKMTFSKDRLPAIAGLARRFHAVCHCHYLAGLWRADLLRGLLWHADTPEPLEGTSEEVPLYHTPSWSWACTKGTINYNLQLGSQVDKSTLTIHRSEVDTAHPSTFGNVMGGSLELTGLLRSAQTLKVCNAVVHRRLDRKPASPKARLWSIEIGAWEVESDSTSLKTATVVYFLLLEALDNTGRDGAGYQRIGLAWCEWPSEDRPDVQPKGQLMRICII